MFSVTDAGERGRRSSPGRGTHVFSESGQRAASTAIAAAWTCENLPVGVCCAQSRAALLHALGPRPAQGRAAGKHERPPRMEGEKRRQRERSRGEGESERKTVAAEGKKGDTDARHRFR